VPPEGLNRAAYCLAGLDLLAERGHNGLTVAALCERLGVTKGSFYHHFRDFSAFVDDLLDYWATEHAARLIALSESLTDTQERFELLLQIAIGLPHGAEAAIRAWSWSNEAVARVQRRVDQSRLTHLTRSAAEAGNSPERARLMATISLSTLIGLQQLERPAQREAFDEVFSQLREWALDTVSQR
jgi:AcrR family transcriptional regulator